MIVSFYAFTTLNSNFDTCLYCGLVAPYRDLIYVLVSTVISTKPVFSLYRIAFLEIRALLNSVVAEITAVFFALRSFRIAVNAVTFNSASFGA